MMLWQTQLNFAMWCTSSACEVSSEHLNYAKHPMVRSLLKRLQVPLPHEAHFKVSDNPYTNKEFFKICEDYDVPHDPMKCRDETFFGTHQHGGWPDYINQDCMTHWIIEKSQGFTDA